jgi:hypothetical protein
VSRPDLRLGRVLADTAERLDAIAVLVEHGIDPNVIGLIIRDARSAISKALEDDLEQAEAVQ